MKIGGNYTGVIDPTLSQSSQNGREATGYRKIELKKQGYSGFVSRTFQSILSIYLIVKQTD